LEKKKKKDIGNALTVISLKSKNMDEIFMESINQELINEFLNKKNIFAVIGVSKEPEKYGNKIFFDLKNAGYSVYPVNPNASKISGNKCYPSLRDLPILPDVVDIVVPPKVTEKTVKVCKDLEIDKIWMQPGSESDSAISFCRKNNIKVLFGVCVMLEMKNLKHI
jgi:predicted CoA-binding protein